MLFPVLCTVTCIACRRFRVVSKVACERVLGYFGLGFRVSLCRMYQWIPVRGPSVQKDFVIPQKSIRSVLSML